MSARAALDAAMTEAEWQRQVVDYAESQGFYCWHDHDSRHNAAGMPDLLLIRERVVFVELKRERGRVTPVQLWFRDLLRRAGQEAYVWRPSDFDEVQRVLGPAKEGT